MAKKSTEQTAENALVQYIVHDKQAKSFKEAADIIKGLFSPVLEEMLKAELDEHLGYTSGTHEQKSTTNRRNGYSNKTVNTSQGPVDIKIPRDREGSFEPQAVPKHSRDISDIEDKVLTMYAKGMSQRDISDVIEDIYGFSISAETVSKITDRVIPVVDEWRNRPLYSCYPFIYIDCLYVAVKTERGIRQKAVYVVMGTNCRGYKEVLGLWISESESKHFWMEIFDELKARGVEDIFFVCMDGVSGVEEGLKAVFPQAITQRCIVHLLRNSLKYISTKDRAAFCKDARKIYAAINAEEAEKAKKELEEKWKHCPGAVKIWKNHFDQVLQLFNYGSAIRKAIYTTNAVESVNSSLRKVVKKGAFPNDESVFKALYLRITELEKKWANRTISNWKTITRQLMCDENFDERFKKYSDF